MLDRLRAWARNGQITTALADDLKDAADEIERLQNEIGQMKSQHGDSIELQEAEQRGYARAVASLGGHQQRTP